VVAELLVLITIPVVPADVVLAVTSAVVAPALHTPPEHISPKLHTMPQLPQLAMSLVVSTQPWPQGVRPAPQLEEQVPAEQSSLELHAVPQVPQLLASLATEVHTPEHMTCPAKQAVPVEVAPPLVAVTGPAAVIDVTEPLVPVGSSSEQLVKMAPAINRTGSEVKATKHGGLDMNHSL
jgi:hypothetical protein